MTLAVKCTFLSVFPRPVVWPCPFSGLPPSSHPAPHRACSCPTGLCTCPFLGPEPLPTDFARLASGCQLSIAFRDPSSDQTDSSEAPSLHPFLHLDLFSARNWPLPKVPSVTCLLPPLACRSRAFAFAAPEPLEATNP